MLMADLRHDVVRTYYQPLERADFGVLGRIAGELEATSRDRVSLDDTQTLALRYTLEMRYAGQDFSMPVPVDTAQLARGDRECVARAFNALHQRTFGYHDPAQPLEIVSVRLAATVARAVPPPLTPPRDRPTATSAPPSGTHRVWFTAERPIDCPIYQRDQLAPAARLSGPAIIQEYASTTLVGPTDRLEVAANGELVITVGSRA
jgi:N-methylhydantoinase A